MEDLERVGKLIALALWALALVAIGILFGGCTSTSSLSRFYFVMTFISKAESRCNGKELSRGFGTHEDSGSSTSD
jgi:hypothetical protein